MHPDIKQVAALLFFLVIGITVLRFWKRRSLIQQDYESIIEKLHEVKDQKGLSECHILIKVFTADYRLTTSYDVLQCYTNPLWELYYKKFRTVYPEPQEFTV